VTGQRSWPQEQRLRARRWGGISTARSASSTASHATGIAAISGAGATISDIGASADASSSREQRRQTASPAAPARSAAGDTVNVAGAQCGTGGLRASGTTPVQRRSQRGRAGIHAADDDGVTGADETPPEPTTNAPRSPPGRVAAAAQLPHSVEIYRWQRRVLVKGREDAPATDGDLTSWTQRECARRGASRIVGRRHHGLLGARAHQLGSDEPAPG
jgi:hypothetical protein